VPVAQRLRRIGGATAASNSYRSSTRTLTGATKDATADDGPPVGSPRRARHRSGSRPNHATPTGLVSLIVGRAANTCRVSSAKVTSWGCST
jgi:hypothetical protein